MKTLRINYDLILKIELVILAFFSVVYLVAGIYLVYTYVPGVNPVTHDFTARLAEATAKQVRALGNGVKEAVTLATTKKPETFTELYFQNHTGLPSRVIPNQEYSFAFTIHNVEYQDMDYPYEIYIEQNGEKQHLAKSSVSVKDREFMTIQQGFVLNKPFATRAKVVINLINKNQSIHFWIEQRQ